MKIATVVGARPQFIKAAPVSKAMQEAGVQEFLIHTGQHYDYEMSNIFFKELDISAPNLNLEVGSGSHGWQTGQMLIHIEEILQAEKPDLLLVYGDTNSTLAGALAACKLRIPIAHVEAGLRSFNRDMPEEHNRILTDNCSDLLFCPTQTAVVNLAKSGITVGVHLVGDTMYDAVLQFAETAARSSTILNDLGLQPQEYLLTTIHRPYNTDIVKNLSNILLALVDIGKPVVFPVHPRTKNSIRKAMEAVAITNLNSVLRMIEPVGYIDMLKLEQNASMILTDSGGIQKEAYFFGVPCITLRPETEWVETVESGWNILVGAERELIVETVNEHKWPQGEPPPIFGDGQAASRIVEIIEVGIK